MNDAIVCEKCGYDLFMINPDGLTVCNQCGEFSTVPNVPPAIDDETRHRLILVCEYLETVGLMFVSPRVISSQIRAILEAGNE